MTIESPKPLPFSFCPDGLKKRSPKRIYLSKNVRYPEECSKDSIEGRVIISFVVERDGRITDTEVYKSVNKLFDAEALRVVRAMPKWTPGRHRGVPVRVYYRIPVNFRLENSKNPVEWIDYDESDPVE